MPHLHSTMEAIHERIKQRKDCIDKNSKAWNGLLSRCYF